jgi:hypothetical protein
MQPFKKAAITLPKQKQNLSDKSVMKAQKKCPTVSDEIICIKRMPGIVTGFTILKFLNKFI